MCGICGFIDISSRKSADALSAITYGMGDMLRHRGPDHADVWIDQLAGIGLGHRRLSVVDLSLAGHQPMLSDSGRYVITYNGEIYNYLTIRRELEGAGLNRPPWRGHSDTEVMLSAIEHWGLEMALERFNGMFAFALLDRKTRILHLCRDRMGEKPLYYGVSDKAFLFGSELKSLKAHPRWRGEIDRNSLALLMRYSFIPAPYSIYKNIYKLPPGFLVSIPVDHSTDKEQWRMASYWSIKDTVLKGVESPFAGSVEEAEEQLDRLLSDAVALRMGADVPLGAFLSGGIDSSVIAALMQANSPRPVKTFSVGFSEREYDEAPYARAVASHLRTDHTEFYTSPEDARSIIPHLATIYDEPFADSSQIPTFLLCRMAREHVTVSLSGDGGDELFCGYNRYLWGAKMWPKMRSVPPFLRAAIAKGIGQVKPNSWDVLFDKCGFLLPGKLRLGSPGDKLYKLADLLGDLRPEGLYLHLVSHWRSPEALVLGSSEPPTIFRTPEEWPELPDMIHRMMYLDSACCLPDDMLVKIDRASMSLGLEVRVPLLDHRIAAFAWSLPFNMKVRSNGEGKWILRRVLYRYLPQHLVDRPKKGFGVPIDSWLRGPLRDWAESMLGQERLRREAFFDWQLVREKWKEHLGGKRNWQYHLWNVLMFQSWLESNR